MYVYIYNLFKMLYRNCSGTLFADMTGVNPDTLSAADVADTSFGSAVGDAISAGLGAASMASGIDIASVAPYDEKAVLSGITSGLFGAVAALSAQVINAAITL